MNISSAKYITDLSGKNNQIETIIDDITMSVPLDPANRHYAAILEWAKEDSNEIAAAD